MAVEVQTPPEPSVTRLVQGIVNDVGDLIKQQFQFAKTELKTDIRRTGETLRLFGVAAAVGFLGLLILSLMLVHLLHWLTLPAGADPAGLPLWACHGIIGLLFLAIGGAWFYAGKQKVESVSLLPEQTAETVKENLEWITSSK
jgi:uncharacterized membrane protein YqjE